LARHITEARSAAQGILLTEVIDGEFAIHHRDSREPSMSLAEKVASRKKWNPHRFEITGSGDIDGGDAWSPALSEIPELKPATS